MDIEASELATIVQDVDANTYMLAGALAVLTYDYTLMFADEVRLVWCSRLSLVKILFFSNRLLGFASPVLLLFILHGKISPTSCTDLTRAIAYIDSSIFVISQLMLSMRVYAIWTFDKRILAFLVMLFVPGLAGIVYVTAASTSATTAADIPALVGLGCLVDIGSDREWIIFTIILIQETSLLLLALLRAFLITKDQKGYTLTGTYRLIVEDNIGYFLCVSLLALCDLCFFRFIEGSQSASNFVILHNGLQSIICARLFLRLRSAYNQMNTETSLSTWRAQFDLRVSSTTIDSDAPGFADEQSHELEERWK